MSNPSNTIATRSGARVRVARTDDVITGAVPLIAVHSDDAEILTLTRVTALVLADMLTRAATTIALTIRVTNSYATGDAFTHDLDVEVPTPTDDDLDDWMQDHLLRFTGEGPTYASAEAVYEVEILTAPARFIHLVGRTTAAEG